MNRGERTSRESECPEHLSSLIDRLNRAFLREFTKLLTPLNITVQEWMALRELTSGREFSGDLALAVGVDKANFSRILSRMESRALVRRVLDPEDRRRIEVEATREGRALYRKGLKAFNETQAHFSRVLKDKSLSTFLRLLQRIDPEGLS